MLCCLFVILAKVMEPKLLLAATHIMGKQFKSEWIRPAVEKR